MKPNFALNLSNDGVELLHRGTSGWRSLGAVKFENDDVQAGCARLVAEAEKLEPGNVRTKLILPESQLRYSTVLAPGPTDEARRYQIEAEIEALTPYSIDELVYDFSVEDDHALIVICARETLAEAEHFAEDAGFNPVAFVAMPEKGLFGGEPNFGETSVARAYLGDGRVQFDAEPVRVGRAADAPTPAAPAASPPASPRPATASTGKAATPARTAAHPAIAAAGAPLRAAASAGPSAAAPKSPAPGRPPVTPAAEPFSKVGDLVRRMGTRLRREQAAAKAQDQATDGAASKQPRPTPPATPAGGNSGAPRPAKTPVPPSTAAAVAPRATAGAASDQPAAPVAFSSRRGAPPVIAASGPGAADADSDNPGGRIAVLPGAGRAQEGGFLARLQSRARALAQPLVEKVARRTGTGESPAADVTTTAPLAPKPGSGAPANRTPDKTAPAKAPDITPHPSVAAPPAATGTPSLALGGERRREAVLSETIVAASRPPASEREKASEAEALTIFGARGNSQSAPDRTGRFLMAGGAVVLLLVSVAAWFLYFNAAPDRQANLASDPAGGVETLPPAPSDPAGTGAIEAPTGVAGGGQIAEPALPDTALAVDPAPAPAPGATSAPDVLADADAVRDAAGTAPDAASDPVASAGAAAQDAADAAVTAGQGAAAEAIETDPNRLLDALVAETLNETLPAEVLDLAAQIGDDGTQPTAPSAPAPDNGTVISQSTPAPVSDSPQLAAASTTSPQRMSLPSSITLPDTGEVAFAPPSPPPPFGAESTPDTGDVVEATPEGALTPSGVTVFAGRPPAVPAVRPAGLAPEPAAPAVPAPAVPAVATPEATAPAAVAPEPVAPVAAEGAQNPETPRADPALAGFRPRARSERVRQIGERLAPPPAEPAATPAPGGADTADPQQDAALDQPQSQTAALVAPPPGWVSLDTLRPQRRPTDLVPPVAEAAAASTAPDPAPDADEDPEIVVTSVRPNARPSDVIARARAILEGSGSGQQEEDQANEAAVAAVQPDTPSSATVALHATETNAIRLSEINLIGVFGSPDNRRALVRLSGGRRVRVGVGDRLNGGQVTAIGESQLYYTRRGRNEILEIGG